MQFHKSVVTARPVCIHASTPFNDPSVSCGRPAFRLLSHGWLCRSHFIAEQNSQPNKPRHAIVPWVGNRRWTDDQIVQDILRSEREAIQWARDNGHVTEQKFGKNNPAVLQTISRAAAIAEAV